MPIALNVSQNTPWGGELWPKSGGTKYSRNQAGARCLPGDRKDQVLTYVGKRQPYAAVVARAITPSPYGYIPTWNASDPYSGDTFPANTMAVSINKAYAKFKEAVLGDGADVGTAIAERRESYGMIANRAIGLRKAYKALRRGNFKQFLRELSVDPKRKHRNVVRSASSEASGLWLEYWFGWKPFLGDIFSSFEVMQSERPKGQRVHGSCLTPLQDRKITVYGGESFRTVTEFGFLAHKTGATVRLTNPDLALANQLGLVNPASIAWEVVPFSFVVDWFFDVGNVIAASTDFLGVELSDTYSSEYRNLYGIHISGRDVWPPSTATWDTVHYRRHSSTRSKDLLRPVVTPPRLLDLAGSSTRTASAVSLLIQTFLGR